MVWPSGAARAASAVPMVPIAPGLFSITNGWPSDSWSCGAMARAIWSGSAPGGKGTTKRTGFCARVVVETATSKARSRERTRLSCINGGAHGYPGTERARPQAAHEDVRREGGEGAHERGGRFRPAATGHDQRLCLRRRLEPPRPQPKIRSLVVLGMMAA